MGMLPVCEVSYDFIPDKDGSFSFLEGCYRQQGKSWEVMVFSRDDVRKWRFRKATWDSGAIGHTFRIPRDQRIDTALVEHCLSYVLGPHEWVPVRGPDSMLLR